VLLVGDVAQLQSVDAGGAFSLLTSRRCDTPTLTEIHRLTHEWEQSASLELRDGQVEVIGTYAHQGRINEGTTEAMLDAAYDAWLADTRNGKTSVLVTEATAAVHALNARARAERIVAGDTHDGRDVELDGGTRASVGDLVITRRNDRRLRTRRGEWVHNGDRWKVTDVRPDGSCVVQRQDHRLAASAVLPPEYVTVHLDPGYAVTAHRAQGMTVGTAHVVVSGSTTRESLYVSMTGGRESSIAYVALDKPDDSHARPEPDGVTARTVLYGVLQHSGVELSAHQTSSPALSRWPWDLWTRNPGQASSSASACTGLDTCPVTTADSAWGARW
jgi:ATP-dependent exoDNAse (exonuclease V) alpha subunit